MNDQKFTIIVPTFGRPDKLKKCIDSVRAQTYLSKVTDCVELIVVDDGSPGKETAELMMQYQHDIKWIVYIRQHRQQRLIARNKGMRCAKNEWLVWIDDDDEFYPDYLETFAHMIGAKPEYSVHQCAVRFGKEIDGVFVQYRILKPRPLKHIDFGNNEETIQYDTKVKEVREHFTSGGITTGQFIFKKNCLDRIGYLPEISNYGDFAIASDIPGYGWNGPNARHTEKWVQVMGNPWGDDFYIFYKLTRCFNVNNTEAILLKKNCR